jgi:hypothetical protein
MAEDEIEICFWMCGENVYFLVVNSHSHHVSTIGDRKLESMQFVRSLILRLRHEISQNFFLSCGAKARIWPRGSPFGGFLDDAQ